MKTKETKEMNREEMIIKRYNQLMGEFGEENIDHVHDAMCVYIERLNANKSEKDYRIFQRTKKELVNNINSSNDDTTDLIYMDDENVELICTYEFDTIFRKQLVEMMAKIIVSSLKERQVQFLLKYYVDEMSLREVGKDFGLTSERSRQIIEKTLRMCRHPYRSKGLREWVDDDIIISSFNNRTKYDDIFYHYMKNAGVYYDKHESMCHKRTSGEFLKFVNNIERPQIPAKNVSIIDTIKTLEKLIKLEQEKEILVPKYLDLITNIVNSIERRNGAPYRLYTNNIKRRMMLYNEQEMIYLIGELSIYTKNGNIVEFYKTILKIANKDYAVKLADVKLKYLLDLDIFEGVYLSHIRRFIGKYLDFIENLNIYDFIYKVLPDENLKSSYSMIVNIKELLQAEALVFDIDKKYTNDVIDYDVYKQKEKEQDEKQKRLEEELRLKEEAEERRKREEKLKRIEKERYFENFINKIKKSDDIVLSTDEMKEALVHYVDKYNDTVLRYKYKKFIESEDGASDIIKNCIDIMIDTENKTIDLRPSLQSIDSNMVDYPIHDLYKEYTNQTLKRVINFLDLHYWIILDIICIFIYRCRYNIIRPENQ